MPHAFANLAAVPTRVIEMVVRPSLEGMFAEQPEYVRLLEGPPGPEAVAEVGRRYEVTRIGPRSRSLRPRGNQGRTPPSWR